MKLLISIFRGYKGISISSHFLRQQLTMKGAIFYGPPGTGKTHLARAIAHSSGASMLSVSPALLKDKYVGKTDKRIKACFTLATKLSPCVLFIDEVDSLIFRRSSEDRSWERSAITQFLQEMDGIAGSEKGPFVIGATNKPSDLDEAFLRRFHKIVFKLPNTSSRSKIIRTFLGTDDIDSDITIDSLAEKTAGYSGSDLRSVCAKAPVFWTTEQAKVDGPENVKLCLRQSHFAGALQSIRPSVSQKVLDDLKRFSGHDSFDKTQV